MGRYGVEQDEVKRDFVGWDEVVQERVGRD